MARLRTVYNCGDCGASHYKWAGKCDSCGAWNTLVEDVVRRKPLQVGRQMRLVRRMEHPR
ncbi:MAG: hypothetical protein NTW88_00360 [Actinobacteria bacterium]|nr:hypothetical protein [Actinomycetota bacterium]